MLNITITSLNRQGKRLVQCLVFSNIDELLDEARKLAETLLDITFDIGFCLTVDFGRNVVNSDGKFVFFKNQMISGAIFYRTDSYFVFRGRGCQLHGNRYGFDLNCWD